MRYLRTSGELHSIGQPDKISLSIALATGRLDLDSAARQLPSPPLPRRHPRGPGQDRLKRHLEVDRRILR